MPMQQRGTTGFVPEVLRTTVTVGGVLAAVDLWQVAVWNPGSLRGSGVAWLIGLYLATAFGGAVVLHALAALLGWRNAGGWIRGLLLAGGGCILGAEAYLRTLSPTSGMRLPGVIGIAVAALVLLWPLTRLFRQPGGGLVALLVVLLGAGGVGAARGFTGGPEAPQNAATLASGSRPNIVLVLIDTLRADHLGTYGYSRPTSPNIDAFAADAVLFEQAFSQSSWTKPAMASLLTGHYPSMHQTNLEQQKLPESETIVTQLLRDQGYRTAVLSGNPWITPDYGFGRGVDHFYSIYDERFARVTLFMNALKRISKQTGGRNWIYNKVKLLVQGELSTTARDEVLTTEASRWLDANHDRPFYMHVHYMSPHHPYDPPPPYDKWVPDKSAKPVTYYPKKSYFPFDEGQAIPEAQREDMIARYDGDILFVDTVFQKLLGKLKSLGILDDTIVIVVADHGEEFYEHKNWGHGQGLYNELIHVPLIIRYPKAFQPSRIGTPVMSVDILPTVLELASAPPKPTAAGRSLVPLAKGDTVPRNPQAFSELIYRFGATRSVVDDKHKLIHKQQDQRVASELYDLSTDYPEQKDLVAQDATEAAKLQSQMTDTLKWADAHKATAAEAKIDDEMGKRLKALGYLN
ncbi:MAG: sulfatase-like hydrolase/transferase [bacterium]|nr:sulfatase-like hydrolase/transferase [bacterium]